MSIRITFISTFFVVMVLARLPIMADTTFTYQGELKDNGALANGTYNMDFSLWSAVTGGDQIGTEDSIPNVPVTNGKFTVELNFGADAFDNSGRWLEIMVNGSFLSPRVPITRSPYSIQTRGIFVDAGENVGMGTTTPAEKLHVRGDVPAIRLQDDTDPSSFTVVRDVSPTYAQIQKETDNGFTLMDIDVVPRDGVSDASYRFFRHADTTGLKRVIFNNGNNSTQASALIGVDGTDSWFQAYGGNFGVGTPAPAARLDVFTDSTNSNDNTARFHAPNLGPKASHIHYGTRGDWYIRSADPTGFVFMQDEGGSVGIGTLNPFAKLGVNASSIPESIGLNVTADTSSAPTIYATNQGSGPALWADGDVRMTGQVEMGPNAMRPAHAYARIDASGDILSGSPNVIDVQHVFGTGNYEIEIAGGVGPNDIIIANAQSWITVVTEARALPNGNLGIDIYALLLWDDWIDDEFSFVIFRP